MCTIFTDVFHIYCFFYHNFGSSYFSTFLHLFSYFFNFNFNFINRASDLYVLYSFCPHLECTLQPPINNNFPNPFAAPSTTQTQTPSPPSSSHSDNTSNSSSSSSSASSSATATDISLGNAIICVRAGPSPETPSLLCITSACGALYVRPLPDFVRWERTRIPSALSQLVNAPIQAVRGTILQVL